MESGTNYWMLWSIYLLASAAFFVVFWRITRFKSHKWLSHLLRGGMLAVALTPWYANQQSTVLAPALMVAMLDAITIGGTAAVRALVPLVLAVLLAFVVASVWYVISVKIGRKIIKKQPVATKN
ncbi:MAG: hypothetical protein EXR84_09800 [Gammaproteobacteria bacterium]|nr:hypothetical protein [Gammaproteobacteria bacterium]